MHDSPLNFKTKNTISDISKLRSRIWVDGREGGMVTGLLDKFGFRYDIFQALPYSTDIPQGLSHFFQKLGGRPEPVLFRKDSGMWNGWGNYRSLVEPDDLLSDEEALRCFRGIKQLIRSQCP